jgi:hypothetical protein
LPIASTSCELLSFVCPALPPCVTVVPRFRFDFHYHFKGPLTNRMRLVYPINQGLTNQMRAKPVRSSGAEFKFEPLIWTSAVLVPQCDSCKLSDYNFTSVVRLFQILQVFSRYSSFLL